MNIALDLLLSQTETHLIEWKEARLEGQIQSWAGGARALLPELARELKAEQNRVEELETLLRETKASLENLKAEAEALRARGAELTAADTRLREALRFYAFSFNWRSAGFPSTIGPSTAEIDKGEKARAALAAGE